VTREHHRITGSAWPPDGDALIMSAPRSGVDALYRVALDGGTITRLPLIGDGAREPMAGRGGLVFSQPQGDSNIYRVDLKDGRAAGPVRPIAASSRADVAPQIAPDGRRIAFLSMRAGGLDIWVAAADGSDARRLTYLPITSGPRWSPDGRWIAFGATAPGDPRPDLWVVDAAGGLPRRLTGNASYDAVLAWSADGATLYFMSDRSGAFEIWSMPSGGGGARQVTTSGGLRGEESRDGRFFYFANDVPEVYRRSLRGAPDERLVTTFPTGTHWGGHWTVGARGLYALDLQAPGAAAIDFLPFDPAGRPRPVRVASFSAPPADSVSVFDVAPDESWLVWAQDDYRNSDVMLVAPR
jgi:Tol biopolymer transport system component